MIDVIHDRNGAMIFTVVIILSVLTILGVCGSGISRLELLISRNEAVHLNDFYISEGGVSREAQEIGNGGYPIRDIHAGQILATDNTIAVSGAAPHEVAGNPYSFSITYSGVAVPAKGFSAIAFNRYDYEIDVRKNGARISSVYCRVGPKPNL